ncbi:MAG TPA: hypothetical protein VFW20_00035 [Candidatus Limnocylindrales bacterium]|nr:hypothetical protein [Candidatus Limnocylindrales bacterium]
MTEWQLRDYHVQPEHFDEFLGEWTSIVLPLRRAHGFSVLAWSIPDESRFVWLIGWDGPGSLEAADVAYYASPERKAVTPDPSRLLIERRHLAASAVASWRPGIESHEAGA